MDPRLNFCWNAVLLALGGNKFTILGDPQSGLWIFKDLIGINELSTPKLSSFGAATLSSFQTQPCKCTKLTDFWEMGFRMRFYLVLVPSVCGGAWFTRLGDGLVFKSKIVFFTPITEFIAALMLSFNSKLPQFSWNFISCANLDENMISSIFEMILMFFSSHRVDSN